MVLVLVGWMYVVSMMAIAEATSSNGTVLGAILTFVLWGLAPTALLAYVMRAPARRARQHGSRVEPDGGGHAAGDAVAPEREKP